MKHIRTFADTGFPVVLAVAIMLTGCASTKDAAPIREAQGPVYDTPEGIRAMAPCKAVVVDRGLCFVYLRKADGSGFYIGSPGNGAEGGHFLDVLKDGKTYKFPDQFLDYQRQRR